VDTKSPVKKDKPKKVKSKGKPKGKLTVFREIWGDKPVSVSPGGNPEVRRTVESLEAAREFAKKHGYTGITIRYI